MTIAACPGLGSSTLRILKKIEGNADSAEKSSRSNFSIGRTQAARAS
jgi:hypothetical protein